MLMVKSATLKVTVILNKRRCQSINQSSLSSSEIAMFNITTAILHNTIIHDDDDATH